VGTPEPGEILGSPGILTAFKLFYIINITMKAAYRNPYSGFLGHAFALQLLEGGFSAGSLSKRTCKSYGYTSSILTAMNESGIASQTREKRTLGPGGRSGLRGFAPAEYVLTRKGRSVIRVVLSGGVFDIIHPGHVHFLNQASEQGDVLVVVVARDSTVKKRKGRLPYLSEEDRLSVVSSLRPVDAAILGDRGRYERTLERVAPDVVFLGHDQEQDFRKLKSIRGKSGRDFEIVVADGALPGKSSSSILGRMKSRESGDNREPIERLDSR
jgi:cytidyltransferase-like protein